MNDKNYIQSCFKLAQNGQGFVSPNPLVGCVIVKDGKIISEGWHAKYGEAHAEAMAIANAKENLKGAVLYCNLEPCCHTNKKTAPCLPLILNAGIKKVVIANRDPNPEVSGKSIEEMRKAGIEVFEGVFETDGYELNRFFFKYIREKRPWVTVKIAQSLDGKISISRNEQTWLTGKKSNEFVHTLRSMYDAVLVGAQTIIADNPQLTVRHVAGRDPIKIVVDGKLRIPENARIFNDAKANRIFIFCDEKSKKSAKAKTLSKYARIIGCPVNQEGQIDIRYILDFLGANDVASVLIEGGQSIFSQCFESNLYDEVIILQTPKILGRGIMGIVTKDQVNLMFNNAVWLGEDCCINLRKEIIKP